MAVYKVNGTITQNAYGANGIELTTAYDVNRNGLLTPSASEQLVVMTFNVQRFEGLNSNTEMLLDIFDTHNPDIIGVQEWGGGTTSEIFTNYPYLYKSAYGNAPGCASKLNAEYSYWKSYLYETAGDNRSYTKAYIHYSGKRICWINTHLEPPSYNETYQVAQGKELFDLVSDEPYFIVTGDINTTCQNTSDYQYTAIVKQFVDAGYNLANSTAERGFTKTWGDSTTATSTDDLTYPCDNIITSSNISIDSVVFDTTKFEYNENHLAIDHIPIVAYLTIN